MTFRSVPVAVNRSSNGHFPLESIVHIDPDHFKGVMSEWKPYVQKAKNDHSIQAGTLCHHESAYIQEIAQEAALEANQNIWVDGSLKDGKWFTKVFQDIRARFPAYRIGIFYVYASEAIIRQRIKVRQEQTGRSVPEQQLMASLDAPDRSLGMLMPHVDFVARINNNDSVRNPLVPSAHLHIRPSAPSILVPETHRQRILTLCTPYACQPAHTAGRSPLPPSPPSPTTRSTATVHHTLLCWVARLLAGCHPITLTSRSRNSTRLRTWTSPGPGPASAGGSPGRSLPSRTSQTSWRRCTSRPCTRSHSTRLACHRP